MQDKHVIDELKRIEQENGVLRAADVVEAARPETSPLHSQFDWNDSAAAEKYRLMQARVLIRVCVEFVGTKKRRQQVFVSLTTDRTEGGGYRSMMKVLAVDHLKFQLLEDAMQDMERFQSRYSHISELAEVHEAMEEAKRTIKGREKRKAKAS